MRARLLLRNSTDRQAKAGTIAAQRAPVRALAARLGAADVLEYVEEAVSGAAPLDERDVLRRLLADAAPGDLVAAFDLSRLTRSDDWTERYAVLGTLRRAGVRAATVEDGEIDFNSLGGRITAHIRAEIAADERSKIAARTAAGRAEALRQGRLAAGRAPFGLAWSRAGGWRIDAPAAEVVRDIYQRVLDGQACRVIAAAFEATRTIAPRDRWHGAQVWRIVTSSTYRGEFVAREEPRAVIAVPPIVDADTWHRAQDLLGRRQRRGLRRTLHVYLLDEGAGRCGCGAVVGISWGGNRVGPRRRYYVCSRGCGSRWHEATETDAQVWSVLRAQLADPAAFLRAVAGDVTESTEARDQAARKGKAAAVEIARLEVAEGALLSRFTAGRITARGLDVALGRIGEERAAQEDVQRSAAETVARAGADRGRLSDLVEMLAEQMDKADASTPAERRRWCRAAGVTAVLSDVGTEVTMRVHPVSASPWTSEHVMDGAIVLRFPGAQPRANAS